ncbi:MAG: ZIP family metal transporter [Bacteroidota bacterium]
MIATVIFLGLIVALAEVLGGSLVVMQKKWPSSVQEYFIALGAGFLLALVFLKLIPESIEKVGSTAPLFFITGFAVIHLFEHTLVGHLHFGEEVHPEAMVSGIASVTAFSGLFIHAFFDGLSISVGMRFDFYLGFLIFFAVLLHKLPEGLTVASIMMAAGRSRKTAFLATAAIGFATMLGILTIFVFATVDEQFTGFAFAFSAGAATYVGASDLIPEINRSGNRVIPLIVFAGMILFYFSSVALEGLLR